MLRQPLKQKHFFYSLVLHVILLSVLVIHFDLSAMMPVIENTHKNDVINAMVIDSAPQSVRKRLTLPVSETVKSKSRPEPQAKPIPEPETKAKLEPEAKSKSELEAKEKPEPEAKEKPEPEAKEKLGPEPKSKPEPEPKSKPEPEALKPPVRPSGPANTLITKPKPVGPVKQAIVIPDKKQKKLKEDLIQKQLLADLKKQTQLKKTQQQQSIESDFANEMKALKAKSLEQQMAREAKRLAGLKTAQMQGIIDKYKALILQSISQHWLVPHYADRRLFAELLIRVAPGGMVLDVQVIKSSGDDTLDRSARAAVFKASPLPVPTDSNEFEPFRQFVLKVKPENVLGVS
jgi:colicin import membrane protein